MSPEVSVASVIFAGVWVVTVGGVGARLTRLDDWYRNLSKPRWQPPDFLFGPVWTVIFLLCGATLLLNWNAVGATSLSRFRVIGAYVANGTLNLFWSYLFFQRRRPDVALRELPLLWLSIVVMAAAVWPESPTAALLLIPYLVWVAFAGLLNRAIVRLNPGPDAM